MQRGEGRGEGGGERGERKGRMFAYNRFVLILHHGYTDILGECTIYVWLDELKDEINK